MAAVVAGAGVAGQAGSSTPGVVTVPAPAVSVDCAPSFTRIHGVTDDGRWFLISSPHDRLAPGDRNAATDVFLIDRATARVTLVSARSDGRAANSTSVAGGMSADGRRIVFSSRASDLVEGDTNGVWDIFVQDATAGTTRLANRAAAGGFSVGSAWDPAISTDGRSVIFRSAAKDLVTPPPPIASGDNWYRHDLRDGSTVRIVTTPFPTLPWERWVVTELAMSPDLGAVVSKAARRTGAYDTNWVMWQDLATGQSVNCALLAPPPLLTRYGVEYGNLAVSADHRVVLYHGREPRTGQVPNWTMGSRLGSSR